MLSKRDDPDQTLHNVVSELELIDYRNESDQRLCCVYEPRCEKSGLRGFRPGQTQTELCSHRRLLEA